MMRLCVLVGLTLLFVFTPSLSSQQKTIPVTGPFNPDLVSFDELMLQFMRDQLVPGAALAVANDGKLVYARGFGHADRELGLPVHPGMRFRIASISKPITAVAILRLIEMGLLRMDSPAFAVLKMPLETDADPRLMKITIKHLLQHTGGWDRDRSFDPMFRPIVIAKEQQVEPPARPMDIIHYMARQKLDFTPGERYAYSNFGYCLLGRVIEKVSGQTYEAFVQKHILQPLGAAHTQLGHTLTTAHNEVHYYDERGGKGKAVMGPNFGKLVPLPYGAWNLEAMDSHGGWISSAPDLVRFASSFDHPEHCKILNADSIHMMFARPEGRAGYDKKGEPIDVFYGCGWNIRTLGKQWKVNTWHDGGLDGTATILVRRYDRLTWAVLFNARSNPNGASLIGLIDPLVHRAADKVKHWPKKDLFDQF